MLRFDKASPSLSRLLTLRSPSYGGLLEMPTSREGRVAVYEASRRDLPRLLDEVVALRRQDLGGVASEKGLRDQVCELEHELELVRRKLSEPWRLNAAPSRSATG
jgi:hypothetical protein